MNSMSPYINPDYYNPLPSPVDVKSSPLAMLAMTCNSIGKDTPSPSKSNSKSSEKKENGKSEKCLLTDKASSNVEAREAKTERGKPGFRLISNKDTSSIRHAPKSPTSDSIKRGHESPKEVVDITRCSPTCSKASSSSGSPLRSSSPIRSKPSISNVPNGTTHPFAQKHSSSSIHNGFSSAPVGYPGFPLLGQGLTPELAAAYHSQLLAQAGLYGYPGSPAQSSLLKGGSTMNPYVNYARVRTPSGVTTLVPVCKDPYCTNCQLTVQTSHTSTTCKTPGCSQCAHEKALLGLSASSAAMGFNGSHMSMYPGFSAFPSPTAGLSPLHSLYSHSALNAHQGLPYVCNWVAGHDYCGNRFNSSEELMQHLRSHTSSIESGLPMGYELGLPKGLSAGSSGLAHLETPAPISPNALRRSYPTSLSPGLMTGSRFHPYKSHLGSLATPPSPQQLLPLSSYYPYSLYAQRLGAAVP